MGEDDRSNLTLWALDLVRELNPPSWTIEQVPTAVKHINAHRPWTTTVRADIVSGWECGAAVLRRRLFLSGGTARLVRTVGQIGDASTTATALPHLLTESKHEIRIRGSSNTSAVQEKDGSKKWNRPLRWRHGERLRTLNVPCFAPVASCSFRLVHQNDGTSWSFLRNMTAEELKLVQGFPANYNLLGPPAQSNARSKAAVLTYYGEINSQTPLEKTVRISETSRIRAVGNSVVPLVAKAFTLG
jgi:site-specific DNA-cytosine methylase